MAWIDASSVKLGCIGFSKTKSVRNSHYGSPLANDVCKEANSKAHLIEIFNDNQSRFLMSEKVRKQVQAHIGTDTYKQYSWWMGAHLKSGTWYWEHSKKRLTYWPKLISDIYRICGDHYGIDRPYPYAKLYIGYKGYTCWARDTGEGNYPSICQI